MITISGFHCIRINCLQPPPPGPPLFPDKKFPAAAVPSSATKTFVIVCYRAKTNKQLIHVCLFVCLFSDQAHVTPLRNWHFAQLAPVHGWSGHLLSVGISTETEGRICPTRRVGSAGTGPGSRPRRVRCPASGRKYFGDWQSSDPALRFDLQTQFGVSLSSTPLEVKTKQK
jgi:hypothetical protein